MQSGHDWQREADTHRLSLAMFEPVSDDAESQDFGLGHCICSRIAIQEKTGNLAPQQSSDHQLLARTPKRNSWSFNSCNHSSNNPGKRSSPFTRFGFHPRNSANSSKEFRYLGRYILLAYGPMLIADAIQLWQATAAGGRKPAQTDRAIGAIAAASDFDLRWSSRR